MAINVQCAACGRGYRVPRKDYGTTKVCTLCQADVPVPALNPYQAAVLERMDRTEADRRRLTKYAGWSLAILVVFLLRSCGPAAVMVMKWESCSQCIV